MGKDKSALLHLFKLLSSFFIILAFIIVVYAFVINDFSGVAFAVENLSEGLGITTNPQSGFLRAENMAPGDTVGGDLTVENSGQYDFIYYISSKNTLEDNLLYNALELTIKDKEKPLAPPLYVGKLNEMQNKELGVLGCTYKDSLYFQVYLPYSCGNEYQGKRANVTFDFIAKEHAPYITDDLVYWDPPLEKSDVNVSNGSQIHICFHLMKDANTFDTKKRGVDLVITGINDSGAPIEYIFSVVDESLKWDDNLNKPHYELHFDTQKYPVAPDTSYTATVMFDGKFLERKTIFMRGNDK